MSMKKWLPTISSESKGFLNWEGVLVRICRGLSNVIFRGNSQYVFKLGVLFSMPWMHMICQRFIEWSPRDSMHEEKISIFIFLAHIEGRGHRWIPHQRGSLMEEGYIFF